MKFSIDKAVINDAIKHVSRVVERRTTIPILANVVISAKDDRVSLRATDLDIDVGISISASVAVTGATTVPAALLADIVSKMAGTEIQFSQSADKSHVVVGAGRSKFKLNCLPVADFPDMNVGAFTNTFDLPSATLKTMIGRSSFAISTEETRYYLNGIFFHEVDGKLKAVATDGHRLARVETQAPDGAAGMPGIIIPRKTVQELEKLADIGGDATFEVSDTKIRVTIGNVVLMSKLIDGTFPDYTRVIPTRNNIVAYADACAIKAATARVATISSERGRAVKMSFSTDGLHLEVSSPDMGTAEDTIDIEYPDDADKVVIGFNARYVADIMANIIAKRARVALESPQSPTIFTDEEGDDVLFVLMPVRI